MLFATYFYFFYGRTEKKAKLSMQDAESFVDRMKQRFARSPGQYDRFLLILQVRRALPRNGALVT